MAFKRQFQIPLVVFVLAVSMFGCARKPAGPSGPSTISIVSGDGQEWIVGEPLPKPLVVAVKDADGEPVSGVKVRFEILKGGGKLSSENGMTDGDGVASVVLTLGSEVGENEVRAYIEGVGEVIFYAEAKAGGAVPLTFYAVHVPDNRLPVIDGNLDDWAWFPENYAYGIERRGVLLTDVVWDVIHGIIDGETDKVPWAPERCFAYERSKDKTFDVAFYLSWSSTTNRFYFAIKAFDPDHDDDDGFSLNWSTLYNSYRGDEYKLDQVHRLQFRLGNTPRLQVELEDYHKAEFCQPPYGEMNACVLPDGWAFEMGLTLWDTLTFYLDSSFSRDWRENSQPRDLRVGDVLFFDLLVQDGSLSFEGNNELIFFPGGPGHIRKVMNEIKLLSP